MSLIDLIILLPVAPIFPILATWFLPWEFLPWDRWVPWAKLPLQLLGPYILYCAFAAWHFELGWFLVLVLTMIGFFISFIAIATKVTLKRRGA